jgi:hypothetical protein
MLSALRSALVAAALSGPLAAQQPRAVALHPLAVLGGAIPDSMVSTFDSIFIAELSTGGYTVVPSKESAAIWRRLVDSVQGFFDPITGDTVQAEFAAVHTGTLRELATRFGAVAWLRPTIEMVSAEWHRGKARWDGASEGVSPGGGNGSVGALTLVVVVEDTSGRVVATGRGGVQVLAKFKGSRFEAIPPDELLTDYERNLKAVQIALQPFLKAGGTSR